MSEVQLPPLPESFSRTREAMHRLAEGVLKVAREHVTGEWTLTRTPGGFGTPVFAGDCQVRVEGADLVVREAGEERRAAITSLKAAAELLGPNLLPAHLDLDGEALQVDPAAAQCLAAGYELGEAVLEKLLERAAPADESTRPTLWPEHFDLAIEMGSEADGLRVNYGLSPGDDNHAEPYFYVGPWTARPEGELWNARGFPGAELSYTELAAAADPVGLASDFALTRKQTLEEMERPDHG